MIGISYHLDIVFRLRSKSFKRSASLSLPSHPIFLTLQHRINGFGWFLRAPTRRTLQEEASFFVMLCDRNFLQFNWVSDAKPAYLCISQVVFIPLSWASFKGLDEDEDLYQNVLSEMRVTDLQLDELRWCEEFREIVPFNFSEKSDVIVLSVLRSLIPATSFELEENTPKTAVRQSIILFQESSGFSAVAGSWRNWIKVQNLLWSW